MLLNKFILRLKKTLFLLGSIRLIHALILHRVFATVEHSFILKRNFSTIVDIGANKGQFTLACRALSPAANIISFEPLPVPSGKFRKIFNGDAKVKFHMAAIGPVISEELMHVSAKDDSSSLLPMGNEQVKVFPGTHEIGAVSVHVAPLNFFLTPADILPYALLKIDVQGYEFEALLGCESLLNFFDSVYCECSFLELYSGQKLASTVVDWLNIRNFKLTGVFNAIYDDSGKPIQADFLFDRCSF